MNNQLPNSVKEAIQAVEEISSQANHVKDNVSLILEHDYTTLHNELAPLESAKLNVSLAFTLATLCFVKMNLQGNDTSKHSIMEDLSRIKAAVKKINTIESDVQKSNEKEEKEQIDEQASKRLKVDSAASKRIVKHHIKSSK